MKKIDLNSMSIEALWTLHEEIAPILATKMEAERLKLKKRLEQITGKTSDEAAERRPYPTVYPMFRIRLTKRGLVVVSSRIGSANCWLPEKQ
jgi:DNA-binding protein H-NS